MQPSEMLLQALDFQKNYESKVKEAVDFLRQYVPIQPAFGITLGTGLGDLELSMDVKERIPYADIPNFPTPTVESHEGTMLIGNIEGVLVIGLKGRTHYYEVADQPFNTGMLKVIFPINVLAGLDIQNYFATNAVGALDTGYNAGDIMIIDSHINFLPNPLTGKKHDFKKLDNSPTDRFVPMNNEYDEGLKKLLRQAGKMHSRNVHEGVYMAVTGPTYETKAEVKAFRKLGAQTVGMSVAPEVIAARDRGMNAVGFSIITNVTAEDGTNDTTHEEVTAVLESPETKAGLVRVVKEFFRLYSNL